MMTTSTEKRLSYKEICDAVVTILGDRAQTDPNSIHGAVLLFDGKRVSLRASGYGMKGRVTLEGVTVKTTGRRRNHSSHPWFGMRIDDAPQTIAERIIEKFTPAIMQSNAATVQKQASLDQQNRDKAASRLKLAAALAGTPCKLASTSLNPDEPDFDYGQVGNVSYFLNATTYTISASRFFVAPHNVPAVLLQLNALINKYKV
jgi:hypothetical protein